MSDLEHVDALEMAAVEQDALGARLGVAGEQERVPAVADVQNQAFVVTAASGVFGRRVGREDFKSRAAPFEVVALPEFADERAGRGRPGLQLPPLRRCGLLAHPEFARAETVQDCRGPARVVLVKVREDEYIEAGDEDVIEEADVVEETDVVDEGEEYADDELDVPESPEAPKA